MSWKGFAKTFERVGNHLCVEEDLLSDWKDLGRILEQFGMLV